MKRGDAIVIGVVLALAIAAFPLAASASARAGGVRVSSPNGTSSVPADRSQVLQVLGERGELTVEVAGGRARVVKADCPDQICVRSGWTDAGKPVVCAPNRVVVESGAGEGGLDAVSR